MKSLFEDGKLPAFHGDTLADSLICCLGIVFLLWLEVGSSNDAGSRTVMKGWLLSGAAHTCSKIKLFG